MRKDQGVYKQVAVTLSKHFDGIYFVDIDTGDYTEVVPIGILQELGLPSSGKNFFKDAVKCAKKCVHPDDLSQALDFLNKKKAIAYFKNNESHLAVYRIVKDGEIIHMRHIKRQRLQAA